MDLKVARFEANEIAKKDDFEYINDREYANLCTIFEELFGKSANDIIVGGLNCQQRGTPSMNVDLSIGLGYCKSTEKIAHTGSLFGPTAIVNGGAQDRIDLIEVRLLETDYDAQQRAKKDPVTGEITYQSVYVKTRFEIEAQVIQGTEGAGVAQSRTAGWMKIAEILVEAGESTSILDADIENCTGGYDTEVTANWTAETAVTFRLGNIEDFKAKFRAKHKENGDHENDVVKDQHIDFGTGANQVSAVDIPILDSGSLIAAAEVENALQEIAKQRVPVGVVIPWIAGYFDDGSNGNFTPVAISLESNYKECNGAALNDAGSPIFNGAGRYLPNLTDDRFLMGNTVVGAIGGDNAAMAHTHGFSQPSNHSNHSFTQPSAHGITNATYTFSGHTHAPGTMVAAWYCEPTPGQWAYWGEKGLGGGFTVNRKAPFGNPSQQQATTFYTGIGIVGTTGNTGGGTCPLSTSLQLSNNHSGGGVNAHSAHSGGSVNAVAESRTNKNIPKYLSCKYVMRVK